MLQYFSNVQLIVLRFPFSVFNFPQTFPLITKTVGIVNRSRENNRNRTISFVS